MKKKLLFFLLFISLTNGQMMTGNDIYTALNSVNEIEQNYAKYFIAGYVTGHWSVLKDFNPYNTFNERSPNNLKYNKMLELSIAKLELYPKSQIIGWDQIFNIIKRYLEYHPNERHEKIEILIRKSMLDVYPLEKRMQVN